MTTETVPAKFEYQAPVAFELSGPPGLAVDRAVCFAVMIGLPIEFIAAGRYRLGSKFDLHAKLREWIGHFAPDASLTVDAERAPSKMSMKWRMSAEPTPARYAIVHGGAKLGEDARAVARAVDAGLTVTCCGLERFRITGRTQRLASWVAAWLEKPIAEAYTLMGASPEQAVTEDTPTPDTPAIAIDLPTREISSVIERDRDGNITSVTQTERTVE